MHGLPPNVNLDFLLEKTVIQIGIGLHDLGIYFHDGVSIMVTSRIRYTDADGITDEWDDFRKAVQSLMVFLGQTVTKISGYKDGTLQMIFDASDTLTIYDDSKEYESYVIYHGKEVIAV